MSSGDLKREIETVRYVVDYEVIKGIDHSMEKWNDASVRFDSAMTGYVNLQGVETVQQLFVDGNESLEGFIRKQDALLIGLLNIAARL